MIKGKMKEVITKDMILSRISTYDIYRYYHGPFKLNKVSVNYHRGETDPSLIIGNKFNELSHKDFGDFSWRGDAFNFVQQVHHGCDFITALKIIDRDFNLGIISGKVVQNKPIVTWKQPIKEELRPPLIQIVTRKMTNEEWGYWARYKQGEVEIKRENIYVPKQIYRNKILIPQSPLMTFCYYYPEIDKWKIYRPYAPKRTQSSPPNMWKWDTNVPFDYADNLQKLVDCSFGILTKSKKDRMVLMSALETECIADVPAEDPACVSDKTIEVFSKIPKRYCVSDNDKKGKSFSWWLTREHGFKHCNVPDVYRNYDPKCTDFPDMVFNFKSLSVVRQHFIEKGVI